MKTIPQAEPFSLLLSLTLISIYGIFHAVHSILDTISDTFGSILDAFTNAFCCVLDTFADTVRGILDSISNAIGICCISASCVVISEVVALSLLVSSIPHPHIQIESIIAVAAMAAVVLNFFIIKHSLSSFHSIKIV